MRLVQPSCKCVHVAGAASLACLHDALACAQLEKLLLEALVTASSLIGKMSSDRLGIPRPVVSGERIHHVVTLVHNHSLACRNGYI